MGDVKQILLTKEIIMDEHKKDTLFIFEKYLDKCPEDWFDCISFISTQGIDQHQGAYLLFFDEEESIRLLRLTSKNELKLFVLSDDRKSAWNVLLRREKTDGAQEETTLFIGGENLRKFCDARNIFYKSFRMKNGDLISGTTMIYQKIDNEDCRKPSIVETR